MKKEKEISNMGSLKNNWYAMKLAWDLCPGRVIHVLMLTIFGYFEWVFFSGYYMRYVIGSIEQKKNFGIILSFILICGGVFGVIALYRSYVEQVVFPLTDTKIYEKLYERLYAKARNVELRCFEDAKFYNKYTMAIDGAGEKITRTIKSVWGVLVGGIATVAVFYTIFTIDRWAVCFIIFPIVGNFLFGGMMNRLSLRLYEENVPNDRVMQYVNRVMYLVDYAKEMRLSNIYGLMQGKFQKSVNNTVKNIDKYGWKLCLARATRNIFTFCIIFEGVMLYAAYKAMILKVVTLAELTVLFSLMVSATWILIGVFESLLETMKNGLFVKNLRGFLEYEERIPEDLQGETPEPNISSIEFRNVTFAYEKEKEIIKNLSFTIKEGMVVAFVGHNGAGKSTIMKLLFRLYDPTEGEIYVNGKNIREYNLKEYRNMFAVAFQDYKVMAFSIYDNVLMGRKHDNGEETVVKALSDVGILEKVETFPNKVHTTLTKEFDEDGVVLSGGQYQKLVIARAFAQEAPIKVFDEPSSALDPIAEYELFSSIMKESRNKTLIFISHRLSSVHKADMVFMLEQGQLIESGTHEELMKQKGSYAAMYKKQAMNYLAVEREEGLNEETV